MWRKVSHKENIHGEKETLLVAKLCCDPQTGRVWRRAWSVRVKSEKKKNCGYQIPGLRNDKQSKKVRANLLDVDECNGCGFSCRALVKKEKQTSRQVCASESVPSQQPNSLSSGTEIWMEV